MDLRPFDDLADRLVLVLRKMPTQAEAAAPLEITATNLHQADGSNILPPNAVR
jgi:hypothetical protein